MIVTRRGALGEIVKHGQTGFVVEAADTAAAIDAVATLMADEELARRLGLAGRREAQTTYSMSDHLDRLERTYGELTA